MVRYPQDKTHITGYAWESWHLRWVGTEVSQHFAPGSNLTLEEYLGLA
ncbi:D-alanyl-D-alanine carboxypeptidase family protein [Propioniciclava sinopodophylli]